MIDLAEMSKANLELTLFNCLGGVSQGICLLCIFESRTRVVSPCLILGYISLDKIAVIIFIMRQNIPRNIEPCPFLIISQHLRYMYQIVS